MERKLRRSPYFWAAIAAVAVIFGAWLGRESYQPVITGAIAPDFAATTLTGEPVTLADFRGKVLLVNVWATWCGPCEKEMPSMQRLYEALSGTDFEILAVSVDARTGERDVMGNPGGDLGAFAAKYGLTFPILHDPSGSIQGIYQTTGVPESFVIDRSGTIIKKVAGPTEWDAPVNQELLRRLLAG